MALCTTFVTTSTILFTLPGSGMQSFPSSSAITTKVTTPPSQQESFSSDPVRASVSHLLARAFSLPCSTAAQAFSQLVQPTAIFQLALDALLPILDADTPAEVGIRYPSQQLSCFNRGQVISPTDSSLFHTLFTLYATPCHHQSFQVSPPCRIYQRARESHHHLS